ncbi:PGPGW domain-containing protein [Bowmanella pacifica]|uniref:Tellurium resistance protein TerC n=1 Tax=Bowmanella pacifica TaxID=502051 RepID=A0A917Z1N1_9ALTE|nr:PGPGW domain-containing protein [Bowmanella pacifica]GGO70486.1 hypothetical protein GCM10010982_24120 [Bowmanella pacifica]
MKSLRIGLGMTFTLIGTVLFILPGSILFLLAGLVLLSVDFPVARQWLKRCQRGMYKGASRLDSILLNRKLSR